MSGHCEHGRLLVEKCAKCGRFPFVDLTTAGSEVLPQLLFANPLYVTQPDMPEGEPDFHELVRMVRCLSGEVFELRRLFRELEDLVGSLKRGFNT